MVDYSSLKVTELKDMLKSRGLGVSGTKSELVARLQESDAGAADKPAESAEEPAEQPATTENATEKAPETTTDSTETGADKPPAEENKSNEQQETKEDQKEPEKEEDLTPLVIQELERRIKRAERFGLADEDTKKQLERIKKLGVDRKVAIKVLTGTQTKGKRDGAVQKQSREEYEKMKKRRERFQS
uniref:ARAD1C09372p n=1 Tax=Blastobotrys adeninivorans TaxID=409370 RepID=A0A060SZM4_BLAAD